MYIVMPSRGGLASIKRPTRSEAPYGLLYTKSRRLFSSVSHPSSKLTQESKKSFNFFHLQGSSVHNLGGVEGFQTCEIKFANLAKLLEPVFGPAVQLPNKKSKAKAVQNLRKKMSKQITKVICSFYRAIIDS